MAIVSVTALGDRLAEFLDRVVDDREHITRLGGARW